MKIQQRIENNLNNGLSPEYLEVINESHMHSVPPNSETHFKVTVVSDAFENLRKVPRHQEIYKLLVKELEDGVHALALHTYSPSEWSEQGQSPDSPQCLGGSKKD